MLTCFLRMCFLRMCFLKMHLCKEQAAGKHTLIKDKAALKRTLGPSTKTQSQTRAAVSAGRAVVNMRLNHSPVRPPRLHSSRSKTSMRRGCLRSTRTSNMRCSTFSPDEPCTSTTQVENMLARQKHLERVLLSDSQHLNTRCPHKTNQTNLVTNPYTKRWLFLRCLWCMTLNEDGRHYAHSTVEQTG